MSVRAAINLTQDGWLANRGGHRAPLQGVTDQASDNELIDTIF